MLTKVFLLLALTVAAGSSNLIEKGVNFFLVNAIDPCGSPDWRYSPFGKKCYKLINEKTGYVLKISLNVIQMPLNINLIKEI